MKKLINVPLLIFFTSIIGHSQIPLIIEGQTYTNSDDSWSGVNIPRSVSTLLTFRNNSITSVNTGGYMLQSGDDGYWSTANNLDNAVISGNNFDWNGTPGATLCHGIMAGYNLNYTIKYNKIDGPFYGIVNEGGYNDGTSMTNTAGGICYNIFNDCSTAILSWGYENVKIYNNTFYFSLAGTIGLIRVGSSNGTAIPAPSKNVKIKNNIFYSVNNVIAVNIMESSALEGFECDYNVYYWESTTGNLPRFRINGVTKSWLEWRALGYDTHSTIADPSFLDSETLIPAQRLDHGTDLGEDFHAGLSTTAGWVVGQNPDTAEQNGTWQVGAKIYKSAHNSPIPIYVNSAIENASPSTIEMTYSLTLANIVPAVSAFTINVNAVTRSVSSVTISGTKVILTLTSPVVYGDLVTVAYTKPSVNPLQTTAGGQAESLPSQTVANNCVAPPNLPPVVIITSPGNNNTFEAPVSITLTVDASDVDGYVSKVEYFIGSAKIGESHIAPFSFTFDCSNAGTFEI